MAAISSPPIPPGDVVPLAPVSGGRVLQKYLAGLDDWELLGMIRSVAGGSGSRAAACELLVSRHRNLVCSCVRRYRGGTEPAEDLMQVGYVGLMKAHALGYLRERLLSQHKHASAAGPAVPL